MKRILSIILLTSIFIVVSAKIIIKIKYPDGTGRVLELESISSIIVGEHLSGDEIGFFTINNSNVIKVYDGTTVEFSEYSDEAFAEERQALIDFYNATDGSNWVHKDNWCTDKPLPLWEGVQTDINTGHVVGINLMYNNLSGIIPESIGHLKYLTSLNLDCNNLTGVLPESFGSLKELRTLSLAENNFDPMPFPEVIKEFTKLEELTLSNLRIVGKFPEWIGELRELKSLLLGGIKFERTIFPESIRNLTKLEILGFSNFGIIRGIPEWIGELCELRGLSISYCGLTGQIPESICKLKNLEYIDVQVNSLSGPLPDSIGNLKKLKRIITKNNLISGPIPDSFKELVNLEEAAIGCNPLCCEIPEWIGQLTNLKYLDIGNAELKGSVPRSILNLEKLEALNLSKNYLTGQRPSFMEEMHNLKICDLSYNRFSGAIPESTDFSADGEVFIIQKATEGKGIDIVFMGDGYIDKDMTPNGKYEETMFNAAESFFAYEPYKSFRNRFNVYGVKAVSGNSSFDYGDAHHALDFNIDKIFEYALKVPNINDNSLYVNVIVSDPNDRDFTNMFEDGSYVAFMFGIKDPNIIVHECGGHGFAKLLDEYVEAGFESTAFNEYESFNHFHEIGWGLNVDYHSSPNDIIWKHFLKDDRYNGQVGIFEGAGRYGLGCYRPTENSMMRYNDCDFNAPSREAIYKAIMRESEGEGWKYDYEEFVKYDEINRKATTRANYVEKLPEVDVEKWKQQHRPPVIVQGTWRDAVNKKTVEKPIR